MGESVSGNTPRPSHTVHSQELGNKSDLWHTDHHTPCLFPAHGVPDTEGAGAPKALQFQGQVVKGQQTSTATS